MENQPGIQGKDRTEMKHKRQDRQASFYAVSRKVRDPDSRLRKADKIAYALTRYSDHSLGSTICLDIGCSSGIITSAISPIFGTMIGLDYDEIALRAIEPEILTSVSMMRGDAMNLPFGDSTVDIIICAQVYEHVPDAERLVSEICRVLIPGGVVFFSGPNRLFPIEPHHSLPFLHWLPGEAADRYLQLTGKGDHYYERLRSVWDLRRLVGAFIVHDFTVEALYRFHLPNIRLLQAILSSVPAAVWRFLLPLFPSVNWILHKPRA
jgi:SAM-dependent methyltransferase